MATESFDEKVVVTNPDVIEMMRADLEEIRPVSHKKEGALTVEQTEANGKRLFNEIKAGLEQAIEYNDGKVEARRTVRSTDKDIQNIQKQAVRDFAEYLKEYAKRYEEIDYYDGMDSNDVEAALEEFLRRYDK